MQRTVITSQPPANLPELLAAAACLRSQGYIVTKVWNVLHPNRQSAFSGQLTEALIADATLFATMWQVPPVAS